MSAPTILISATNKEEPLQLKGLVAAQGYNSCVANGDQNLLKLVEDQKPQLAIACIGNAKPRIGLHTLQKIRCVSPTIPIILITNSSSETLAVGAIKAGVSDYFISPYSQAELLKSIGRHMTTRSSSAPTSSRHKSSYPDSDNSMVCTCKQMQELKDYLIKIAALDATVLITGETGTGKEMAAELIHRLSHRHKKPFVCVNCAALPENLVESELFGYEKGAFTGATVSKTGKFSQATGGTLFLDEIGDMSLFSQAKVLRSIESKQIYPLGSQVPLPVDLRVIAATNQDLEDLIAEGNFRSDLYYRLNVARVHLPPLRDRCEDIPALVSHGIHRLNHRHHRSIKQLTDEAMATLLQYDWPGNIRELMNILEAAYVNSSDAQIDYADLPEHFKYKNKRTEGPAYEERAKIVSTLLETTWNKSAAAQKLKWSRMTLYRKMRMYNIVQNRQTAM